ncbi:hypothetical protein AWM70_19945 [Paenibacillus yonginensis]|uniref:HAMP domain-containing protein n=1 Tax=Paenibacillus yonginensis TaxID=1462996 RepID=A0A1B1N546_9BACL|nr:sensor histidine kinase [Paenibacillus yonginensis]ANS76568.1 hypothetical protein AWM70_19945 [Paenibacillus yonginensis]
MIRNSIRKKLLILLLAATMIPICSSIVISYYYTRHSVTETAIEQNSSRIELGKLNALNYFNTLNQLSVSIYSGINVADSLYTYLENTRKTPVSTSEAVATSYDPVYMHLFNLYQTDKDIYQMHFYIANGSQSNLWVNGYFRREYNPGYRMPKNQDGEYKAFIQPTHINNQYGLKDALPLSKIAEVPVFTLNRPMYLAPTVAVLGYLSIDVRLDGLNQIFDNLYSPERHEQLYLLDQDGRFLYSSQAEDYGTVMQEGWEKKLKATEGSGHFEWRDGSFSGIIFYDHLDTGYMNTVVVKKIPFTDLYHSANELTGINSGIAAASLIVAMIGTVLISLQITRPLKQLLLYVKKVQKGNLLVPMNVASSDEIGILARRMETMMETIDELILREYKLELANKTNQLKALQAQINPHFLYNAMQLIGTQALHSGSTNTYRLVGNLAKMMRYSMNNEETEVPLRREIEHVKAYLELQRERFEGELEYSLDFEEATLRITVPKMLLQPLVENYFKHGYDGRIGKGDISLRGYVEGEGKRLVLQIDDNGTGMEPEALKRLVQRIESMDQGTTVQGQERQTEEKAHSELELLSAGGESRSSGEGGIGWLNVVSRLRLQYGNGVAIRLENRPSSGLSIRIMIPLQGEKEDLG